MASHLLQLLLPSHTPSSTTESRSTIRLDARSLSSPMSTLASCPFTRRSPAGGTSLSSVRLSESETQRVHVLTAFAVTMFGFGIVVIELWHSEFPVWAFILALIIGASPHAHGLNLVDVPPLFSIRVHDSNWCHSRYHEPGNHH
jgi:hypothetical protein